MVDLPSEQNLVNERKSAEVIAAPSGVKQFPPSENCTRAWLVENGWTLTQVPYSTTSPKVIARGIQARRTQYGIKPRVSSTIHVCMGSTLPAVVTSVSKIEGLPYDFDLWEAALVVVLLTRTRRADQLVFVGDRVRTIQHMLTILQSKQHRFHQYMCSLLDKLCGETEVTPILQYSQYFRPSDIVLTSIKAVYLAVSTRRPEYHYIGETPNLAERLRKHNQMKGPAVTQNETFLPFAVQAYVTGFQDKGHRCRFESLWKVTARRYTRSLMRSANGLVAVGRRLVEEENQQHPTQTPLCIVQCGFVVQSNVTTANPS
jgi:predicted GIY-YIG superfamily endonuclease